MLRLFTGIPFFNHPDLVAGQSSLKEILTTSRIKWVDPQNFHLTLKFLGDVESHYLNSLRIILRTLGENSPTMDLEIDTPGYFGSARQPRILWYGLTANDALLNMQKKMDTELEQLGFKAEEKPFHAHITLGRVKQVNEVQAMHTYLETFRKKDCVLIHVGGFTLFRSDLKPQGPVYTAIEEFTFGR